MLRAKIADTVLATSPYYKSFFAVTRKEGSKLGHALCTIDDPKFTEVKAGIMACCDFSGTIGLEDIVPTGCMNCDLNETSQLQS